MDLSFPIQPSPSMIPINIAVNNSFENCFKWPNTIGLYVLLKLSFKPGIILSKLLENVESGLFTV